MNIHDADDEIIRCLSSKNDVLRMEAQFALVRLHPENSYSFLDELEKKLTLWEQLNIYENIAFHHLDLPDFERLLKSKNNSVVLFSLRMVKVFKLKKLFNTMAELLSHPDDEVRNQTIQVMGNLKMVESLPLLKKIYKNETYDNCVTIIQAMGNMPDESMLSFLNLVLDKEDDVQLQIEAAIAINKVGEKGSEALQKLLKSDYKNYQIIIKHVLDKRIS
ncbi:MAG: HEAT repeat domain-containing protein [Bacteroidetes bacterium]|nr:HEAT repeat domain-containing protein [Bacteroidota bacterium]